MVTEPKKFSKAPLVPVYTNFDGERAPKKRDFLVNVFQKMPKKYFFFVFFIQNFACGAQNLAKTGSFEFFGKIGKGDKIFEVFLKISPCPHILFFRKYK